MAKRILIIDDDNIILRAFLLALEDTPYEVSTVNSGKEGIKPTIRG